ncbi:MAG: DNA/RNA non-specific endonuclease [Oscillospiraceae bacterium]|nr:DNA/RNA non-specific endonuclease [Oscillospiraceae bacterium]
MQLKKTIALLLAVVLCAECLSGCGSKSQSTSQHTYIPEQIISETFVDATTITEENITEELVLENLKQEENTYELTIDESFFCEAYIIEVVVGTNTVEDLRNQLPADIDNYDIDWPAVIGKFAAGTAIIITVGIVHHYTKGATYYFFASPAKVAKDAFVGGAMFAALNTVRNCKDGELPRAALKKYIIEGFADGYMWGAICSVGRTLLKNLKLPTTLKFLDGTKAKIKLDGSVVNAAGEEIGKAYYSAKGIFIKSVSGDVPYLFNTSGKQLADIGIELLTDMAKGRLPANTIFQLGLDESAQSVMTDAAGTIFQINGELLPNITYRLGQATYQTDALGRITKVTFEDLALKTRTGRLPILNTLQEIGRGFQRVGDDRGHLIADRFSGNNSLANIVAMNGDLNKGAYKAMEDAWAEAIVNGEHVSGTIELAYSGSSFRPSSFDVAYSIGAELFNQLFSNL